MLVSAQLCMFPVRLAATTPKPGGSEVRFRWIPQQNTCTWVEESGRCRRELVRSVQLSLSHPLECVTFSPAGVIQRGTSLCSPGEHKQLPALLIHAGALAASRAQHPTGVLRREIICSPLPAEQLISLAAHSCRSLLHCSAAGC